MTEDELDRHLCNECSNCASSWFGTPKCNPSELKIELDYIKHNGVVKCSGFIRRGGNGDIHKK